MPSYDIEIPGKGTFRVDSPTDLTDKQAYAAVLGQMDSLAPKESTFGESISDLGASLYKGAGMLAQTPGQIGMLAGIYKPEEAETGLQGIGMQMEKSGQAMKSEQLKAKEAARAQKVGQAQGIADEFWTAIKETATDPALMTSFFAEQVPNLIGSMGAGLLTKGAVKIAMREATEAALQKSAVAGMVGAGSIMQGADVGADTFENLYDKLRKDGMPAEKAAEVALDKGRMAAIEAAGISVATTFLPGGTTLERALVGRGLPRTGGIVKGFAGEAAQEGLEEGGGKLVSNIQEQALYPETDIFKGVGEAAGMGALMGGAFGGIGGVSLRAPQAVSPTGEPAVEPTTTPTGGAESEAEAIKRMEGEEELRKGVAQPEPTVEPTIEPTVEPTIEPITEPAGVAPVEPTAEPVTEPAPVEPAAVPKGEVIDVAPLVQQFTTPEGQVDYRGFGEELGKQVYAQIVAGNQVVAYVNNEPHTIIRTEGQNLIDNQGTKISPVNFGGFAAPENRIEFFKPQEPVTEPTAPTEPRGTYAPPAEPTAPTYPTMPEGMHPAESFGFEGWEGVKKQAIDYANQAGIKYEFDNNQKIAPRHSKLDWDILATKKNAKDLLTYLHPHVPVDYQHIIDRILPSVGKTKIEVNRRNVKWNGRYSGFENVAEFSRKSDVGNSFDVILHELTHAATVNNYLDGLSSQNSQYRKAAKEMEDLVQQISRLGKNYSDLWFIQPGGYAKNQWGMELIARAMTNRRVQDALKKIKIGGKTTGWSKFVSTVRKLLGLDARDDSALSRVLDLSEQLMAPTRGGRKAIKQMAEPIESRDFTPEFSKWFEGSAIVNQDGSPMQMYHGTNYVDENGEPITSFRKKNGAVFLSPDPSFANKFAMNDMLWNKDSQMSAPENAHVIPVFASAKNPFDYQNAKHINQVAKLLDPKDRARFRRGASEGNWQDIEDFLDSIKEAGFDAAYISEMGRKNLAVFEPNQIKSVFNAKPTEAAGILEDVEQERYESLEERGFTPEFRKWFGNSKITNDDGTPQKMYHATRSDFDTFHPGGGMVLRGEHPEGQSGTAIWFSPYPEKQAAAHNVGVEGAYREGANVIPVYLKMERPLLIDDKETLEWAQNVFAGGSKDFPQILLTKWKNELTKDGEYDGIIFKGEDLGWGKGSDEYIVFNPNQIKSVFNANPTEAAGILEDVDQKRYESPRQTVTGAGLTSPPWTHEPLETKSGWSRFAEDNVYKYVDKFVDLKKIIQAINKTTKKLDATWDAYMKETLYHNRVAYQTNEFLKNELKPLAQEMVARGVSEEDLNNYLLARHAEEYNNAINARNDRPDLQHRGSGVHTLIAKAYMEGFTPAQVAQIRRGMEASGITLNANEEALLKDLAKMTEGKRRAMAEISKRIDKMVKETQDIAVKGGIEKQNTIDYWRDMYPNYVPLKRTPEELDFVETSTGMGRGFSARAGFGKAATGSLKGVDNILSNLILQRDMAIVKAEKARIGRALYAMALSHPNPSFWLPVNPNASIISKANDLVIEIMKMKRELDAVNATIDAKRARGDTVTKEELARSQELSEKIRRENARHEQMAAEAEKVKKQIIDELVAMGLDPKEVDNLIREPQGAWYNPATKQVEYRTNNYLRASQNVLAIPINGETRYIFFNPGDERAKRLVTSLRGADVEQLGQITSTVAKFTRWIAMVNTQYNPFFGIVNMIRDVQGAQFNLSSTPLAGQQMAVNKNIKGAVGTIYRSLRSGKPTGEFAQEWVDFQQRGGPTGMKDMLVDQKKNESVLQKEIQNLQRGATDATLRKGFKAAAQWMSDFNDTMENAVRLAAFIEAKKKFGKTMSADVAADKAAELAKNLTVNFNRKGAKTQFVNSLYAFFNAAIQGTSRMVETLKGPSGKKIMGSLVLLGVIQQLALSAAGFDDDDPPEFVREKNIVIPTGDGKYLSWPMPLGFNLFVNLGRIGMSAVENGGKNIAKDIGKILTVSTEAFNPFGGGSLVQAAAPTVLDPAVALYGNVDAFGRPIYRADRPSQPSPGYLRSTEGSTAISRFIAEALNRMSGGTEFQKGEISPTADHIDYIAGQLGGGTYREARKVAEFAKNVATGEETAPYRVPLAGRFMGDTGSEANVRNKFYENVNKLAGYEAEIKGRAKSGKDVGEFLAQHPDAAMYKSADSVYNEISKINKVRKQMIERGASKEQLKQLNDAKIQLMRQFNQAYEQATK